MQSAILRSTLRATNKRSFSAIPSMMAGEDTGSPKAHGFMVEKDQFTRREAANEGMYIYELEKEKLELLRKKLKEHKKHNEELDKHLEELLAEQGGEKN
ncbi:hypothetical protein N7451_008115 [Penicillium sp. IBT 35674x]|nr:hypothetical protein N7451_008115 [Penicillium sp. IBT 35674x]